MRLFLNIHLREAVVFSNKKKHFVEFLSLLCNMLFLMSCLSYFGVEIWCVEFFF